MPLVAWTTPMLGRAARVRIGEVRLADSGEQFLYARQQADAAEVFGH